MADLRNSAPAVRLARSSLRNAGVWSYQRWSRARASGSTPPILLNSIPKSGTHLVANVLDTVPGLRYSGVHVFTGRVADDDSPDLAALQRWHARVRRGQYFTAHVRHTPELGAWLLAAGTPVVFACRHPFDIALSLLDYIAIRPDHRCYDLVMHQRGTREERLEATLFGATDERSGALLPSLAERLSGHVGWLDQAGVVVMRFERLRGDDATRAAELLPLAALLEVDVERLVAASKLQRSTTMNVAVAGRWERELPEPLRRRAAEELGPQLDRWGFDR